MGDTRFSPALPGRGIFLSPWGNKCLQILLPPVPDMRPGTAATSPPRDTKTSLKRFTFFSLEKKNVNRLRKNHMFQTNAYFIGYQQNNTILKKKKIRQYGLGNGACGRRKGEGDEGKATWGLTKSMPEKSCPKDTKLCRTQRKAHFPLTRKRKGRFLRQNPPSLSFPNPRPSFLKPHRFPF